MIIVTITDKDEHTTSFYFINDNQKGSNSGILNALARVSLIDDYSPYLINYYTEPNPVFLNINLGDACLAYFNIATMLERNNLHESMINRIVDECIDNEDYCEYVLCSLELLMSKNPDMGNKYIQLICEKIISGLEHRMKTVTENFKKFHNSNKLDNIKVNEENC